MMDEAHSRAAPLDCHNERGDGEFGTHVLAQALSAWQRVRSVAAFAA